MNSNFVIIFLAQFLEIIEGNLEIILFITVMLAVSGEMLFAVLGPK